MNLEAKLIRMGFVRRKTSKELAYRMRFRAMSSHDQVESRKLKRLVSLLVIFLGSGKVDTKLTEKLGYVVKAILSRYLCLNFERATDRSLRPIPRRQRTIVSFNISDVKIFMRFQREHLVLLLRLLRFPDVATLTNRCRMTGEEVLLRGLYELTTGMSKHNIATNVFGGDGPLQSRAFSYFVDHLYDNFHVLVHDNLSWWYRNGFFRTSAEAIGERMKERGYLEDSTNLVAHFIDCNCLPTSVVGGGPAEGGANAMRWNDSVQRAFYNGWKSVHGLKHQTVDNAYGFTIDMTGPTSLRRNDLTLLRISNINERMAILQQGDAEQYVIFGDSAYKPRSHSLSYLSADSNVDDYVRWNGAMKGVRIAIEWNYGQTASLFKFIGLKGKLQVLGSSTVSKVYTVATLLRNFHVALYGSQTSNYFNLHWNGEALLEKYITQTDF